MNRPVIGSYKKPIVPADAEKHDETEPQIVDKRPKVDSPTKALSEGVQEDLKDSIERTKAAAEKAKTYEEILSDHDISLSKAHAIVDAMLEKGFYEETLPVTKTVNATFRTRTQADYVRYLRALEIYNPKYVEEQQEIQIRYFLGSSLLAFKGVTFTNTDPEKLFDEKIEWLEKQPERIVNLLATKLSKFDKQVQIVMSEGVVENF